MPTFPLDRTVESEGDEASFGPSIEFLEAKHLHVPAEASPGSPAASLLAAALPIPGARSQVGLSFELAGDWLVRQWQKQDLASGKYLSEVGISSQIRGHPKDYESMPAFFGRAKPGNYPGRPEFKYLKGRRAALSASLFGAKAGVRKKASSVLPTNLGHQQVSSDVYGEPRREMKESPVEKSTGQQTTQRYLPKYVKYDTFHGILKRVSDMKMTESLDSEEHSTGSEKSPQMRGGRRRTKDSESTPADDSSNASPFGDESSVSSSATTQSDHCQPYEEVAGVDRHRYSCISLPATKERSMPGDGDFGFGRFSTSPGSPMGTLPSLERTSRQSRRGGADEDEWRRRREEEEEEEEEDECFGGVGESEKHQLEMFFRSLKTEVFVCESLVNLYVAVKEHETDWTYKHTGVVVVILDCGCTRSRSKRKIQILLAERGTCFPLWKDTIDNLSSYRKSSPSFHTMYLSSDHRQIIGLSFDSPSEADKLLTHIEQLTSNPENINISVPGSKKKPKSLPKKKPAPLPHKKHISNPCLFQHVTSVAARDKPIYMSLQTLIDSEVVKKNENIP